MRPLAREVRTLARIQGNTNLAHTPDPPTIEEGSYTHTPPRVVVPVEKPPKPPTTGELRLPVGESIVRRLMKPVGMACLLFALNGWAATSSITAPHNAAPATLFPGVSPWTQVGIAVVTDPAFGAIPLIDNPSINPGVVPPVDSAPAINAAIQSLIPGPPFANGPDGGTVYLPAGVYYAKCPAGGGPAIGYKSANGAYSSSGRGLVIQGAGQGATLIVSDTAGTGCSIIGDATPKTCDANSGTGSCDAPPTCTTRSTRGAGCPCYNNLDCGGTGTCTGGRLARNVTIRDLAVTVQKDNMVGFDMAFCTTCKLERVTFDVASGITHTHITGALFSDGSMATGTLGGYDNDVYGSNFASADICIRAMKQSNDLRIFGNAIGNTCGSGLVIEGTETVQVTSNLFQSTRAATCSGGTTCSGGYHHGAACAVAADCHEADIIIGGFCSTGSQGCNVAFNHIEDGNNPHILLGDGGGTAQTPGILMNAHFGAGKAVTNNLSTAPFVFEPNSITADKQMFLPGAAAPFTCSATTGGTYYDTTCGVLCSCNVSSAKWCRSDTGVCNTATDCC